MTISLIWIGSTYFSSLISFKLGYCYLNSNNIKKVSISLAYDSSANIRGFINCEGGRQM